MQKIKDLIIYRNEKWYSTFPCLVRTPYGDIICGFRRAPMEGHAGGHIHSLSRAAFVRSRDDGETWSADAQFICPEDELGQQDPQLATLSDGKIMASFFRWQAHPVCDREHLGEVSIHQAKDCLWTNAGIGICFSKDNGTTWGHLQRLPNPWPYSGNAGRAPAVELNNGQLILPCYTCYGNRNQGKVTKKTVAYLLKSDDKGITWSFLSMIADSNSSSEPFDCDEPFVVQTKSGRLLCFIRSYGEKGLMRMCASDDGGLHWTPAVETKVWGYPQAALRLRDNRIVLAYGYRQVPFGVRVRLLDAEGENVNEAPEFIARDDSLKADCGYPAIVERNDGSVLLAYYLQPPDYIRIIAASILDPDA